MDDHGLQLLDELVKSKGNELRAIIPADSQSRGSTLFPLLRRLIDATEAERLDVLKDLSNASDITRSVLGRKLLRHNQKLDVLHMLAADYVADVDRQDIPVGLLCLIDTLIDDLLPNPADPLVHLVPDRMYSTLTLTQLAASLLKDSSLVASAGPIVFNLPALDPANALLSPILAHEVGHTVVQERKLLNQLTQAVDLGQIDAIFKRCLAKDPKADPSHWKGQLGSWISELLCDALATALTGPSFLYASATFLPAPSRGGLGSHPFPAERVRFTLSQLDSFGWQGYLGTHSAMVTDWLRTLESNRPSTPSPEEEFLTESVALMESAIASIAAQHVVSRLDVSEYSKCSAELCELFDAGIPPSRLQHGVPTPWQLILCGWEVALQHYGNSSRSLGQAVSDRAFNAFLIKGIELVRITQLWDAA